MKNNDNIMLQINQTDTNIALFNNERKSNWLNELQSVSKFKHRLYAPRKMKVNRN